MQEVCNQVIDTCLYKGSRDNMSIVVVALKNSVLTDADSIAKEKELDASIERTMREMFEQCEDMSDIDAPRVLHRLNDLYGDRMPPGGGLAAKYVSFTSTNSSLTNCFLKPFYASFDYCFADE